MAISRYVALTPIRHNGKLFAVGEPLALTDVQAASLGSAIAPQAGALPSMPADPPQPVMATMSDQGMGISVGGEPVFGLLPDSLGPSFVSKLLAANPHDGKMRVRVAYFDSVMTQGIEAVVPIANGKHLVYRIGREAVDGLIRLYSGWVADKSISEGVPLTNTDAEPNLINLTFPSPAFSANTTSNPYTLVVGTELNFSFAGTGLDLITYSSSVGGLWRVEINGGAITKEFSVWRASSGKITTQIARGLPRGTHSVKMTFLGQDPANPTASPRGWVSWAIDTAGATIRSNAMVRVADVIETYTKVHDLSFVGNVSEAAIKWRKNGAAYDTTFWPNHGDNNVTGVVSQTVYIDGAPTSLTTPELAYRDARQIDVVQSFTCQNPNEGAEKLANGLMLARMTANGYEFACQLDILQAVNVSSAYVCMPGCYNSDIVRLNSGQSSNTSAHDDATETMSKIADSALMYAPDHPYAWAYKMQNWRASTRVGKSGHVPLWTRVQARLQGTRTSKVYNYIQDGSSVVWPAGERLTFGAHFCGGYRPQI